MSDIISFKAINDAPTNRRNIRRSSSPSERQRAIMASTTSMAALPSSLRNLRFKNLINGRRARGVEAGYKHLNNNFVFKKLSPADQQRFRAAFESRVRAKFSNLLNVPVDDLPAGADTGRQIAKDMLVEYMTLKDAREAKAAEEAEEAEEGGNTTDDEVLPPVKKPCLSRFPATPLSVRVGYTVLHPLPPAGINGAPAAAVTAPASESESDFSVGPSSPVDLSTAARAVVKSQSIPRSSLSPRSGETADPTGTAPRRLLWMQLCTDDAMVPVRGLRRAWAGEEGYLEALGRAEAALEEASQVLKELERMGGLEGLEE